MGTLANVLAFVAAGISGLYLVRARSLWGSLLWIPKAVAGSASPLVIAMGALGAVLGALRKRPLAVAAGAAGALLSAQHLQRVSAWHDGLEAAFGGDWKRRIPAERRAGWMRGRWMGWLPAEKGVCWERDRVFWRIPESGRELLCDLWLPPIGVNPSRLVLVYLHGGAWHFMDKDCGTRPMFQHLAAQGHAVMDVAYRMCPEVGLEEMVGDVKRAVAWAKDRAGELGIDPERVVLGGGSAGAHLAMLAAYAPNDPALTPAELAGVELSVRGVISYYGPTDMRQVYAHFEEKFRPLVEGFRRGKKRGALRAMSAAMKGDQAEAGGPDLSFDWMMQNLLGGAPADAPELYELASPLTQVGPDSPATLLLQGEHDSFVAPEGARALYERLREAGVPVVLVSLAQTEHGFDLLLPRCSPAGQAALYDVERFLALMAYSKGARCFHRKERADGFTGYLRGRGWAPEVRGRAIRLVRAFAKYLAEELGLDGLKAASPEALEAYVVWVEREFQRSARADLRAIWHYYDFSGNEAMREAAALLGGSGGEGG